jgi:hypothetical protein
MLQIAYHILSLESIGCNEDIPENASTIEGNTKANSKTATTVLQMIQV